VRPDFLRSTGVIYDVTTDGDLVWYRHFGRGDGSFKWAQAQGQTVNSGFKGMHVIAAGIRTESSQYTAALWSYDSELRDATSRQEILRMAHRLGAWSNQFPQFAANGAPKFLHKPLR
jgi:hypothetical protein